MYSRANVQIHTHHPVCHLGEMTWPLRFRLSHLFNGNSLPSSPTGVWPFPLLWGIHHGSWCFRQRAPQVLPGCRPEAGELGSLWSRRTAKPRENPACQLPPASAGSIPQSPAQGGGRRTESQVMPLVRQHSLSPALASVQGREELLAAHLLPHSLLPSLAFQDKGEEKPTSAGGE